MAAAGGHWVKGSFQPAGGAEAGGIVRHSTPHGLEWLEVKKDASAEEINAMLPSDDGQIYPAIWDNALRQWMVGTEEYGDILHADISNYAEVAETTGYESRFSHAFYDPETSNLTVVMYDPEGDWYFGMAPREQRQAAKRSQQATDRGIRNAWQGTNVDIEVR